jgi:hypothetical protein
LRGLFGVPERLAGARERMQDGRARAREVAQAPFVTDTLWNVVGGQEPRVRQVPGLGYKAGGAVFIDPLGLGKNTIFQAHLPPGTEGQMGYGEETLVHEAGHIMEARKSHPELFEAVTARHDEIQKLAPQRAAETGMSYYPATDKSEHFGEAFRVGFTALRKLNQRLEQGGGRDDAEVVRRMIETADIEVPGAREVIEYLVKHELYRDSPAGRVLNRKGLLTTESR